MFAGARSGPNGNLESINPGRYTIDERQVGFDNHGTGVATKVVGHTLGVAKKADLVIVKWPTPVGGTVQLYHSSYLDGLRKVADDVTSRQAAAGPTVVVKSVLNMSFGVPSTPDMDALYVVIMNQLLDLDIVLVAGSGNCRRSCAVSDTQW